MQLPVLALAVLAGVALVDAHKPKFTYGTPKHNYSGVKSRNKNGPTNPAKPQLGTPINQNSDARLATINSIDDWCTFGPKPHHAKHELGQLEATTVAYCTKPRNNARVIPDGTIKTVSFVRTPLYIQLYATGDFTKINFKPGDEGGELDPHGATNQGNPVGGNVTSNIVDGKTDVFYEEWMNYVSATDMCFRVCIAGSDEATPGAVCQHTLDEMGCQWVMPMADSQDDFETCDADAAYPPGLYPKKNGSTSTFQQFYTGVYTGGDGKPTSYTNGSPNQHTPSQAYSIPSSSNCHAQKSPANGIPVKSLESKKHKSNAQDGTRNKVASSPKHKHAHKHSQSGTARSTAPHRRPKVSQKHSAYEHSKKLHRSADASHTKHHKSHSEAAPAASA